MAGRFVRGSFFSFVSEGEGGKEGTEGLCV